MKIYLVSDYNTIETTRKAFYTRSDALTYLKMLAANNSDVVDEYLEAVRKLVPTDDVITFSDWFDEEWDNQDDRSEEYLWDYELIEIPLLVDPCCQDA